LALAGSILSYGSVPAGALKALCNRVAIFAHLYGAEGFGPIYLQAMRAELAWISGAHDATSDVFIHETGILVDPSGRDALAASIVALLRVPERRAAFDIAVKQRFQSELTFDRYRDRLRPILLDAFA
jgi:glycosyltransferase involved in cell wall biosynthesis